jgi:hypothetical protein
MNIKKMYSIEGRGTTISEHNSHAQKEWVCFIYTMFENKGTVVYKAKVMVQGVERNVEYMQVNYRISSFEKYANYPKFEFASKIVSYPLFFHIHTTIRVFFLINFQCSCLKVRIAGLSDMTLKTEASCRSRCGT